MIKELGPGLRLTIAFTILTGLLYPAVMTGLSESIFPKQTKGSLVTVNGTVVGSSLIGQAFVDSKGRPIRKYFQSRPSAALGVDGKTTAGYDPTLSSGSNLGPTNPTLIKLVAQRAKDYRALNGLAPNVKVPVDAVTASASGLDPDISVANARLQAARVARARGVSTATVLKMIDQHTDGRPLGILGEKTVNVLDLNLALDQLKS